MTSPTRWKAVVPKRTGKVSLRPTRPPSDRGYANWTRSTMATKSCCWIDLMKANEPTLIWNGSGKWQLVSVLGPNRKETLVFCSTTPKWATLLPRVMCFCNNTKGWQRIRTPKCRLSTLSNAWLPLPLSPLWPRLVAQWENCTRCWTHSPSLWTAKPNASATNWNDNASWMWREWPTTTTMFIFVCLWTLLTTSCCVLRPRILISSWQRL
eukprot:Lithocolla_globosa_v1_NODE_743_length_3354_cov_15.787814.p2 type:complete len:210 gc:universal NODE_743_length_3354_cov_15.787814:1317-1946(+)